MEERKTTTVKVLKDHLNLRQLTGDKASLRRQITLPNTNRPGLELTGFFAHAEKKRIVIIGNKETAFLRQLPEIEQDDRWDFLTNEETPLILITGDNPLPPTLEKIAKEKNFPVFSTDRASSEVMVELVTFLDEELAPTTNVHGVLMNVYGRGVLIIGGSGMGKSELALELINRGHSLVADDRVDISRVKDMIIGTAPVLLKGMLEIRGIGIIDIMKMFGTHAYLEAKEVDFVVELEKWDDTKEYRRVGIEEDAHYEVFGLQIPHLIFPVREGRNMSVLVESAVRDFILKQRGVNTAAEFDERVMNFIQKQNEEQLDD
ncbi:HPr(Ser) kinase/phosphatase [Erysipelothrix sp. HDW6C]|uniref:HPr(Ser) kinase/phosphatase n=1 Tax=Erysipelothrix sp. HDW6C TaxID=2714930 RepID=UPI00140D3E44|nr:HPr(Ser) kinase/phosphatase [Erysipelothrix sp. HDW6C]QIK68875.1 HPr(Ser) kinase/phosphatase [Erysipelothrix sp. HDW6C]